MINLNVNEMNTEQLNWLWATKIKLIVNPKIDSKYIENEKGFISGVKFFCEGLDYARDWRTMEEINNHGVDFNWISELTVEAKSVHNSNVAHGYNYITAGIKIVLMDTLEKDSAEVPKCFN